MSSSKLSLCVEIELISIGVEEQKKGGKLKMHYGGMKEMVRNGETEEY